ncbi:MAG: ATP-binding protein [Thermoleophilaceae bacterium]
MDAESAEGQERKLATVLFADLVGSTAFASGQDPERVSATLERFYDAMAAEIEAAGGTVRDFAGDAVLAVFGVPAAFEDHAERALHVALAMQRRLREVFGETLSLRIGVNTGEVVVAKAREGSSLVTGDVVNVAARLEQGAPPGEILVGERTVAAVRAAFQFSDPETIVAKGKAAGVPCRRLLRAVSLARPRGVGGLNPAFVGRDAELRQLREAYGLAISEGRPYLVTVVGDAGVGKSRLVRELWPWFAAQEPQPLQRTGRCLSYARMAYRPLVDILKEQLGLSENDPPEAALELLRGREILGLTLGLDVAPGLHPMVVRDRFQDAWASLFEQLASERPVTVLIEDLHWAEEPLLDLIEHVLVTVRGSLLVIGTARPELFDRRPGWSARTHATAVTLERLDTVATDRLLRELLGAEPPEPLRAVAAQAEGNPFFLEELLGSLVDRGLLRPVDGGWTMDDLPTGFAVPDSVQAVVAARIDLLAPAEKAAIQAASVMGRIFWSGPVYELLERVEPNLHRLEERDFIRLRPGSAIEGEREYTFKHAVTREVAYAGVPRAKRARLHAAFAAWLERFGGGRDDYAPLVAHHYAEAARPADADLAWAGNGEQLQQVRLKAIATLRRAAELAAARYEIDEALGFLHRALELGPDRAVEARLWHEVGRANALKYDGEAFWTAMQRAIELSNDPALVADMYSDLARETVVRAGMWRRAPDATMVDDWIEHALELAPAESAARAKALMGRALWGGDAADAAEASSIAERLNDSDLRASALMARSLTDFREGNYEQSLSWAKRGFGLMEIARNPDLPADPDLCGIWPALALGRFEEARSLGAHCHEVNMRFTSHHRVHGVAVPMEIEELLGDWESVRRWRDDAQEAIEANLATPCMRNPRSLLLCALAEQIAGNSQDVAPLIERAEEMRMHGHGLALDGPRARLALVRGDLDTVQRLLAEDDLVVLSVRRRTGYHLGRLSIRLDALAALGDATRVEQEAPRHLKRGTYLEPFALRALGIVREDEHLIDQALERFRTLALGWHAAQTRALAGT